MSSDLPPFETLAGRAYVGIGARATPPPILRLMAKLGSMMADYELILRSGAVPGADSAFEQGCDWSYGRKEIFLPWKGFCKSRSPHFSPPEEAGALAAPFHSEWASRPLSARLLHARSCQQVCGESLEAPAAFVLFWAMEWNGRIDGGTSTAVLLARELKIPTFNLREAPTLALWQGRLRQHEERRLRCWQASLRALYQPGDS